MCQFLWEGVVSESMANDSSEEGIRKHASRLSVVYARRCLPRLERSPGGVEAVLALADEHARSAWGPAMSGGTHADSPHATQAGAVVRWNACKRHRIAGG